MPFRHMTSRQLQQAAVEMRIMELAVVACSAAAFAARQSTVAEIVSVSTALQWQLTDEIITQRLTSRSLLYAMALRARTHVYEKLYI